MGDTGVDALTGAGLINAYRAIYGSVVAAKAPLTESFDAAGLRTAWDIQGRGPARAIGRGDYGPASLPGHLVLDGFFPYATLSCASGPIPRVAEATLRLYLSTAATGATCYRFGTRNSPAKPTRLCRLLSRATARVVTLTAWL